MEYSGSSDRAPSDHESRSTGCTDALRGGFCIDDVAVEKWDAYTEARNDMLVRTSFDEAPWHVVRTNNKKAARLNVIRHILSKLDCPDKDVHMARPDEDVIFAFSKDRLIDLAA